MKILESFPNPISSKLGFSALFNAQPFQCIIFHKLTKLKHMWKLFLNCKQTQKFFFSNCKCKTQKISSIYRWKIKTQKFLTKLVQAKTPTGKNLLRENLFLQTKISQWNYNQLISFPSRKMCQTNDKQTAAFSLLYGLARVSTAAINAAIRI